MTKLLFLAVTFASVSGYTCSDFSGQYTAPYDSNVVVTLVQDNCDSISMLSSDGYKEVIPLKGEETTVDHNPDFDIITTESCTIKRNLISCTGYQVSDGIKDTVSREYRLLENEDMSAKQSVGSMTNESIFKKK